MTASHTTTSVEPPPRPTDLSGGRVTILGRLARWCYQRRRTVVLLWIAGLLIVTGAGRTIGAQFKNDLGGSDSESARAQTLLRDQFPAQAGDSAQVVFRADNVSDANTRTAITNALAALQGLPHVSGVRSPYAPDATTQLSADGHVAYGIVQFDTTADKLPNAAIQTVVDRGRAATPKGLTVEFGGAPIAKIQAPSLGASEAIGILAAVIILLLAFGSVIAMGLPILTAIFGIVIAFGALDVVSHALVVPTFGPELAALIGLGVGIDYALLIITRYRQHLHDTSDPERAIIAALATSGRSVVFAGSTVVISLLGLTLIGLPYIYGLAAGAIGAVVLVMTAALTLLPALVGFAGPRIDRLSIPHLRRSTVSDDTRTIAWRWSRVVQRHPAVAAVASLAILVALAIPLFAMRLAYSDAGNAQTSYTTRRAYDLLADGFGPGANGPLVIAARLPAGSAPSALDSLTTRLAATGNVAHVSRPRLNPAGDTAVVTVIPATSPQDAATQHLVHEIRDQVVPSMASAAGITVLVGGETAAGVDSSSQLSGRLPFVIGAVVLLSFILLIAVFRSIVVPLKAAVMNLLSVGAAYGVIVAVFQWGWLGSIIGIGKTAPIDPWVPVMLFTILFGLSMDYEVFLLSRVREEWLRTGDNATAVANGLAKTARVITAAAAIMVCVFGSFVLGDVRVLKLFGLGMAAAVLVDATLVRMVLVPATMELLGDRNWWLPRWLQRVLPTIHVDADFDSDTTTHVTRPAREPVLT